MCESFTHMGPEAKPGHMCARIGYQLEWLRACATGFKRVMDREEAISYVANMLPHATTAGGANLAEYLAENWTTKVGVLLEWEDNTMTVLVRGWDKKEDEYILFTRTYLPNTDLAKQLWELQATQNQGRGVDCVRTICHFLEQNDRKKASACCYSESDKLRSYPTIIRLLAREGLWT